MTRARDLSRLGNRNAITASSTNNIGIGSTIPDTKLDVVGDVFVTGVVTATSYSGDGSALTGIAATANVVTDSLVVSGVSTFNGNVNIDNVTTELSSIVNVRKADGGNLTAQFDSGGQATLYYDGTQRIQTQTNGVVVNGKFTVQAGDILPGADATQDLGATDKRFANIYSADLQLSNEGSSNDVDGTWGKYTIQEGEDDLFLINRRTGKKYKFMLEEVE